MRLVARIAGSTMESTANIIKMLANLILYMRPRKLEFYLAGPLIQNCMQMIYLARDKEFLKIGYTHPEGLMAWHLP
jgi:hypothetical protein